MNFCHGTGGSKRLHQPSQSEGYGPAAFTGCLLIIFLLCLFVVVPIKHSLYQHYGQAAAFFISWALAIAIAVLVFRLMKGVHEPSGITQTPTIHCGRFDPPRYWDGHKGFLIGLGPPIRSRSIWIPPFTANTTCRSSGPPAAARGLAAG
jgi:hypothetical protein